MNQLLHRRIDPVAKVGMLWLKDFLLRRERLPERIVLNADKAEELGKEGKKVILVSTETTPDDIHGIVAAQGVLTSRGGDDQSRCSGSTWYG